MARDRMTRRCRRVGSRCVPATVGIRYLRPMATDLTPDQRTSFLAEHPAWDLDGETITATFVFADFIEAIGFVTRVAMAAEVADHHPDIDIRWNKVTLALTTHDRGALTSKDLDLAASCDAFAG